MQVSAVYPGATAEDVAKAVAAPIEQQLSGVEGLLYFKSSNASDGTMNLQVYFDLSRDLDLAAVDVQNQVNVAEPQLPQEVVRQGLRSPRRRQHPRRHRASASDPRYDVTFLNNYAAIYIIDEPKRIPHRRRVADRPLEFSMPLSLDPDRMAQLGLTVRMSARGAGAEHHRSRGPDRPRAGAARQSATLPDHPRPAHRSEGVGDIIVRADPPARWCG